jgi:hypothetical protein
MRSFSSKSPFSFLKTNESIPLIIFIFIFLGVGLYFFINKLTEKQQQNIADAKSAKENDEVELNIVNSESKDIVSRMAAAQAQADAEAGIAKGTTTNKGAEMDSLYAPSTSFNEEVRLFIKRGNENPEVYAHTPLYVPPFGTGKETRCTGRQINPPTSTTYVQSSLCSNLVKTSSDAAYLS